MRKHLKAFDEKQIQTGLGEHSRLGQFDYGHIPLSVLKEYFPSEYAKVKNYFSFAIIRNPITRFASSVNQRLFMHKKMLSVHLTKKQINNEVDEAIELLTKLEDMALLPANLIHFQRQASFIYDNGDSLIDNLYIVENIKQLFDDLEQTVGLRLGHEPMHRKYNASHRIYKNGLLRTADKPFKPLRKAIMRLLPDKLSQSIENSMFVYPKNLDIFRSDYVISFIRSYYKEDIKLYNNEVIDNGNKLRHGSKCR